MHAKEERHFAGDPEARSIIWEKKKIIIIHGRLYSRVGKNGSVLIICELALTGSCPPQLVLANANQIYFFY